MKGAEVVNEKGTFEEYLLALGQEVILFLKRKGATQQDAEDAVAQTYYKIYVILPKVTSENLRPWFYRVALNNFIDLCRKTKREKLFLERQQETEDIFGNATEKQAFLEHLVDISKDYQEILILKYYYNFSYDEIAELLQIKPESVKKKLQRARKKAKNQLEESKWS